VGMSLVDPTFGGCLWAGELWDCDKEVSADGLFIVAIVKRLYAESESLLLRSTCAQV
jgi:hypothetical protein